MSIGEGRREEGRRGGEGGGEEGRGGGEGEGRGGEGRGGEEGTEERVKGYGVRIDYTLC